MPHQVRSDTRQTMSRRAALKGLAVLAASCSVACTPLRIAMRLYPEEFDEQSERVHRILRAFVETVVPGVRIDEPDLVRPFYDSYYPLAKCRGFFASDLCNRTMRHYSSFDFERLSIQQRTKIVAEGLAEGGTTGRVYTGAVFLTQIAVYAGIYDPDRGCPLIDFDGRYRPQDRKAMAYPNPERFLPHSISGDGNPA